jgi:hypothetical protein
VNDCIGIEPYHAQVPKPIPAAGLLAAARVAAPADNPRTPEKIVLGQKLFFRWAFVWSSPPFFAQSEDFLNADCLEIHSLVT